MSALPEEGRGDGNVALNSFYTFGMYKITKAAGLVDFCDRIIVHMYVAQPSVQGSGRLVTRLT